MPLFDDLTEREVKAVFEYLLQQTLEAQRSWKLGSKTKPYTCQHDVRYASVI
ncbi:MAG: hypothetical protein CM15mP84_05710 [Cellvibrionales bacterium]|nr:MAG: hypothetical protein CM15mP84_05710 [Cellvibrionales bacterium]